ncbi:MAG: hypothetical protein IH851_03630 [Armatimonadetes bacterium]|nr:hypothetical protein [Armatimonadota bacterium]
MSEQELPKGWSEERVKRVADHYDNLSDEELAAEIEGTSEEDEAAPVSPEQAREYLREHMAIAARMIEKLADQDAVELYRQARAMKRIAKEQSA